MLDIIISERWMQISKFEPNVRDCYYISDHGRVYNKDTSKIMSTKMKGRYCSIGLYHNDNKQYSHLVHRLVGVAFVPGRTTEKNQIDHKDTFHDNNFYTNLEWVTSKENIHRAFDNGLREYQIGINHHFNKYDDETIHKICKHYKRGVWNMYNKKGFFTIPAFNKTYKTKRTVDKNKLAV